MRHLCVGLILAVLSACAPARAPVTQSPPVTEQSVAAFAAIAGRVAPEAERQCRARNTRRNCDFLIFLDDRPGVPPNAFQTVSRGGRPVIVMSGGLLAETRNVDEVAFVLGHEAAHHIAGHMEATIANARLGAQIVGSAAQARGYRGEDLRAATAFGAELGALRFSKEFELEADALGAVITYGAGYDAVRGAAFFARIPDSGDEFLGTHPPNAQRQAVVRRVARDLGR